VTADAPAIRRNADNIAPLEEVKGNVRSGGTDGGIALDVNATLAKVPSSLVYALTVSKLEYRVTGMDRIVVQVLEGKHT